MEQNEIFGRNPIDTSGTPGGFNSVGLYVSIHAQKRGISTAIPYANRYNFP